MDKYGSKDVARAAIVLSMTRTREEEKIEKVALERQGIHAAAVDFGGEFISAVTTIISHTVVAAKREGVILDKHAHEGAVAGATREAISQMINKAIGMNIGSKIGIARSDEHIAVAIFAGIGMLHLNEVAIGLGHRAI